ncbi:MAG TPA: NAD(P)-dependent oxidoreductase [Fluviicola sp.]|nr:NAD(P)-dependent oxidoreductase [Fluviicola sp.]
MKLLITGSNGLLGQKIVKRCLRHNIPFLATSKGENRNPDCPAEHYQSLDITVPLEVGDVFFRYRPTAVIHTAAHTNVDFCEENPEECFRVNAHATMILWEAAKIVGAHFQLVSTDFVFDGEKGNYAETDRVNPLSVYAHSKVAAENCLRDDDNRNWSIARTIIVYGTGNNLSRSNLVLWALEALPKGEPMRLVNDQFRAPTWADDLAYGCVEIVLRGEKGIFHLSGPETVSIDQLVKRIAAYLGIDNPPIETISSAMLNQPAKRPPRTGFDLSKSQALLDYSPKTLEESLAFLLIGLN